MRKQAIFNRLRKALMLALLSTCVSAGAATLLHCKVTYAASMHKLDTLIGGDHGSDPYTTESIDIDGRFRFKTVILGTVQKIEAIKLYAYYETRKQPVLIEEAKYLPPFASSDSPY